jgi:hypothetical protein
MLVIRQKVDRLQKTGNRIARSDFERQLEHIITQCRQVSVNGGANFAATQLMTLASFAPSSPPSLYAAIADICLRSHQVEHAEQYIEEGLEQHPTNHRLLSLKLRSVLKKKDLKPLPKLQAAFKLGAEFKDLQPDNVSLLNMFALKAAMEGRKSEALDIATGLFREKMLDTASIVRLPPLLAIFQRFDIDIGLMIPASPNPQSMEQLASYQHGKKAQRLEQFTDVLTRGNSPLHLLYAIELSGTFRDIMRPTATTFLAPKQRKHCENEFSVLEK